MGEKDKTCHAAAVKDAEEKDYFLNALGGCGLSVYGFAQLIVAVVGVLVLSRHNPEFQFLFVGLSSPVGQAVLALVLFWFAPLGDVAYAIDRIGALRAQTLNLAPYLFDPLLVQSTPQMIPHLPKIIANIEQIGPFMQHVMQPGVKEHMLPVMPALMVDLEVMLPNMELMKPVLPKIAPHIKDLVPHLKEMLPYTKELLPIVEVDGWHLVNPHLDKVVPHLGKIAAHADALAKAMPEMLPQIDVLVKHIDNMMDCFEETIAVLDKLVPLMPLMPMADKLGLLDQKLAFALLPTVIGFSPLSNDLSGKIATQAAAGSEALLARADSLRQMLKTRYESFQNRDNAPKAIEDAPAKHLPKAIEDVQGSTTPEENVTVVAEYVEETKAN